MKEIPFFNRGAEHSTQNNIFPLHRGVWVKRIEDGMRLPVGGSYFSNELNTFITFDAGALDIEGFTAATIQRVFRANQKSVENWLRQYETDIDPYLYFTCLQVQNKVWTLLEISETYQTNIKKREEKYRLDSELQLLQLRGMSACAERAALAQYLLQRANIGSAYMGVTRMENPEDLEEYPEAHSFVVIEDPRKNKETLIFDVALASHPRESPRLLRTDVPLTADLFQGKDEGYVRAVDIYRKKYVLWYGIGDMVAGIKHHTLQG